MHISDRAIAYVYFILGFIAPLAFIGFMSFYPEPSNPYGLVTGFPSSKTIALVGGVFLGALIWIMALYLYARNRPAWGRNDDDVRRNIKAWYRDAKKWMDEHPEHVEMKDL